MIIENDEKKLLFAIKTIPLCVFLFIAIIGTVIVLYVHKTNFNNEINKVKNVYLKSEKEFVKQEIIKIHNNIQNEKELTEEKLKINIKDKVYEAYSIVNNIYKQNNTKSQKEIIKMATDSLRDVRFNDNRGYFFMYKMDGTTLLLPTKKSLEGTNLIDLKDAKGTYSVKSLRDLSRDKGESFFTWWWYKPNQNKYQSKKIGFVKYFKPLDCFIGTGEYVEDFEETIKRSITNRLSTYRYGKEQYIFIFNEKGTVLAHRDINTIGTNNLSDKNTNDIHATYDIISTNEDKGKFLTYAFKKAGDNVETQKISYVKQFKEWKWMIGSGFYTDDLRLLVEEKTRELTRENESQMKTIMIFAMVIALVVIILSLLLSYVIKKRFEDYKSKVQSKDKLIFQQSKMAAMGEMLENIAHQWRQPLSVITTGASGIKIEKEYNLLTDEHLESSLDNIIESADHLSQTVDDFRNFYKEDRIQSKFKIEDAINKAIQLVHSKFKNKDIEIVKEISDIEVLGFKNELIQVIINILNNTRDVFDSVDVEKKVILISIEKINENAIIKFCDNGCGVEEENLTELFNHKFTTKSEDTGTGIGLYMSKLIVEKVGGTIEVQNTEFIYEEIECKGAEFIITLPLT